ncbi:MAG: hypothetical protein NZ920_02795 [Aigarchaeota archaeon]|nr:hypothetical protein [Aigarchaeota archaeon]MDW8092450.1 hypothetical protein [Nitrososphaerota archaeon]
MGSVTESHLVGLHARSEGLMKLMRLGREGKVSFETLKDHLTKEALSLVELQSSAGLTRVVDGQLAWHDLLRPISENVEGLKVGPLARWFDNNVFYKKPIVHSRISWNKPFLPDYLCSSCLEGRRGKLVIADPFTFAKLSENNYYRSFDDLVLDLSEAIATEIIKLGSPRWLSMLQFSSPVLVKARLKSDDAELFTESINLIKRRVSVPIMVHTFFGDLTNALPLLLDAKVEVIGFDLTVTDLKKLREYDIDRTLCVGLIDARNSYMESEDQLLKDLSRVIDLVPARAYHISPTADLEFLPKDLADEKVRLLGRVFKRVGGDGWR